MNTSPNNNKLTKLIIAFQAESSYKQRRKDLGRENINICCFTDYSSVVDS